jgi:hypothetical protein
VNAELRLQHAYQYDITPLLHAHIRERHRYDGNVVLEFAGPTGTGKSSCMLGLMETHHGLRGAVQRDGPEALQNRLSVDLQELPQKLKPLGKGDAVCMDEQFHLMGEGAETRVKTMRNLEDTLRGTGISIYYASPGARNNHDASQGILTTTTWSPPVLRDGATGRMMTRFLFSLSIYGEPALPLGTVTLPWCSPEVFAAYSPIKAYQLDRTRMGVFHSDARAHEHIVKRLFDTPEVLAKIRVLGKPDRGQLKRLLTYYGPSMSTDERDALATEIEDMLTILRDARDKFDDIYHWTPTQNMIDIATRGATTTLSKKGAGITGY